MTVPGVGPDSLDENALQAARTCGCDGPMFERRNPTTHGRLLLCERHAEMHDQGHGGIVVSDVAAASPESREAP